MSTVEDPMLETVENAAPEISAINTSVDSPTVDEEAEIVEAEEEQAARIAAIDNQKPRLVLRSFDSSFRKIVRKGYGRP